MYPDSAPGNWKEILASYCIPIAVSPLHAPDPMSEKEYKPHWHVILKYGSVKSYNQVKPIADSVNATIPVTIQVFRSAFRYLCHLDQPDKPQYDPGEIIFINGFNPKEANKPTDTQMYEMIRDIVKYISANQICYYIDLLMMSMFDDAAPPDWGYTVSHNTTLFSGACESLRKKIRGM